MNKIILAVYIVVGALVAGGCNHITVGPTAPTPTTGNGSGGTGSGGNSGGNNGGGTTTPTNPGGGTTTPTYKWEPDLMYRILSAEVEKYREVMPNGDKIVSKPNLAKALNDTACKSGNPNVGLSQKKSGNNCSDPSGRLVACDILQYKGTPDTLYDVISSAGDINGSKVERSDSGGPPPATDRIWLAPVCN
jgi:hypothetical protein